MDNREVAGVRRAITWLHEEAKTMNDPHAVVVLNNAAFHLGLALRKWQGKEPRSHFATITGAIKIENCVIK